MDATKIKELRELIPIPMQEAKILLEANSGDIQKCVSQFKEQTIQNIIKETGCDKSKAIEIFEKEKLDVNRTISAIKEMIYDSKYQQQEGINEETLLRVRDWLYIMQEKDFGVSLGYKHLQTVIDVFDKLPKLLHLASMMQAAKNDYDRIFEGYTDDLPLEDFVKRNVQLDDCPSFQVAFKQVPLELELVKDEVRKHWRNVPHIKSEDNK